MKLIDPPEGWKYGFPKHLPSDIENNGIIPWLISNGYPQSLIDEYGDYFYYRFIETEVMEEDQTYQIGEATNEELKKQTLAHYDEVSKEAMSWNSAVPTAIEYYYDNKDKEEPNLKVVAKSPISELSHKALKDMTNDYLVLTQTIGLPDQVAMALIQTSLHA